MSDNKDNAPKPKQEGQGNGGSGDASNNPQNRRRRGGRNRNNRNKPKEGESSDGRKPSSDQSQAKQNTGEKREGGNKEGGNREGGNRNKNRGRGRNRNRNQNKGPVKEVKAAPVSEATQAELATQADLYDVDFNQKQPEVTHHEPVLEKPVVGITCGDLNGIGMEIIIKTLEDLAILDFCTPVVFASSKLASYHRNALNKRDFNFFICDSVEDIRQGKNNLINVWDDNVELSLGTPTDVSGSYALKSIDAAIEAAKAGHIQAIVTAPINKHNIAEAVEGFSGHTGHLASAFENDVLMILASESLRVATVTGHVPVSTVASSLTEEAVVKAISTLTTSLKRDFGLIKPSIAVLGLNPHAGEQGTIGSEEAEIIKPAIEKAQSKSAIVKGPFPADGFFGQGFDRKFDAVLGMYHDQVLVPFKALAMGTGTNFTAGLSTVRTSPDHGTAMHLAGKGSASEHSFRASLFAAIDIVHKRSVYDEMTSNPLKKQKDKR